MSGAFLTVGEAAAGCGATCDRHASVPLAGVFHDTRVPCPGGLYVAIRGTVHDGHDHVTGAVRAGAVAVLVDHPVDVPVSIAQIQAADCRIALHMLAAAWRNRLSDVRVIGVTGTAGKTTTKDLLHAIAIAGEGGFASPRSFNNDIGVPLTVLGSRPDHHLLIAEVGTSSPGEIAPLAAMLQPHVAIITCIDQGHLEGLGSVDEVRREKYELAAAASVLVLQSHQGLPRPTTDTRVETFGMHPDADHVVSNRYCGDRGMLVDIAGEAWPAPLPGRHGAMNVAAAVCAARAMGCSNASIRLGIEQATIAAGRFGVSAVGDMTIIDDSWNSNPASAAAAIEALEELADGRSVALVLGAMLELGAETAAAHRQLGELVRDLANRVSLDVLVLVGGAFTDVLDAFPSYAVHVPEADADMPRRVAAQLASSGRVVLVKGSRAFRLERVVESLKIETEVQLSRRTMSE